MALAPAVTPPTAMVGAAAPVILDGKEISLSRTSANWPLAQLPWSVRSLSCGRSSGNPNQN